MSGKVVELNTGPEGLESFVMDSNGELLGVTLTDGTYVKSWLDALSAEDFLSGSAPDAAVTVYFGGPKSSLVTGSGEEIKAQEAEAVYLTGFLRPDTITLADGTELGVWQYEHATAYAAEDGTELLKVRTRRPRLHLQQRPEPERPRRDGAGEHHRLVRGQRSAVRRAGRAGARLRGLAGGRGRLRLQTWGLSQRIVPTALSEGVAYFLTTVGALSATSSWSSSASARPSTGRPAST
ncbi:MAG: hypothetical protein ACLUEK_05135 [Oscillospiraceae bacterium]